MSDPSPHPFRPGQVCRTRHLIGAQVYRLPDGLAPGVLVKTIAHDHGTWTVEEVLHPERKWRVYVTLLDVVPVEARR